jgi:hypothetical protein
MNLRKLLFRVHHWLQQIPFVQWLYPQLCRTYQVVGIYPNTAGFLSNTYENRRFAASALAAVAKARFVPQTLRPHHAPIQPKPSIVVPRGLYSPDTQPS